VHPRRAVERFGKEASEYTKQALFEKEVFLAFDWDLRDKYRRLLAYIYLPDGSMHNANLISGGFAHAYVRFPFQFIEEFRELEKTAQADKLGVWGS
jgi:micrococcal nuclease